MGTPSLFAELPTAPPRVEILRSEGKVMVRVRGVNVLLFDEGDVGAMHCAVVGLVETNEVTGREVAQALGIHEGHLSRLRRSYRKLGSAGLMPERPGPRGKSKLTAECVEQIRKLRKQGRTIKEVASELGISPRSVVAASGGAQRGAEQLPLAESGSQPGPPSDPAVIAEAETASGVEAESIEAPEEPASGPEPASIDHVAPYEGSVTVQNAGAMMLHVPLGQLGLVQAFEAAGAHLAEARVYDLAGVLGTLALGFGLGLANVEQFKLAVRGNLGPLAGLSAAPEVRTLRRKLYEMSDQLDMTVLAREVARGLLDMEPAWEGLYFVDGHFTRYTGQLAAPKTRDPKKQGASRGRTDTWVHDVNARPLFFLTSPVNEQLVSTIPRVVTEIRAVTGEDSRVLLVFDRGGYSAELFHFLTAHDVDFATYVKGTPKNYEPPPDSDFRRRYWTFEGKRRWYWIAETELTLGENTYRVIVKRDDDKQIPIITNLWEDNPAKIVHLVKIRWRQENGLKDLVTYSFIDGIVEYGGDEEPDTVKVPHPKRETLKLQLAEAREQRATLEANLGREAMTNPEKQQPTMRGFKIAHSQQRAEIAQLQAKERELEEAISLLPATIRRCDLDPDRIRVILRTERRMMVNTIKLAVDNAERWLSRKFLAHFQDLDEYRSRLRSLLRQPGHLHWDASAGQLVTTLHPPDSPKVREALGSLLDELNSESPRTLDGRWALRFTLGA